MPKDYSYLATLPIVNRLAMSFRAGDEELPPHLVGATIEGIGTFAEHQRHLEITLVIDYRTPAGDRRRLVLSSNDEAMWVQADLPIPVSIQ